MTRQQILDTFATEEAIQQLLALLAAKKRKG